MDALCPICGDRTGAHTAMPSWMGAGCPPRPVHACAHFAPYLKDGKIKCALCEVGQLRAALKVMHQAILEFSHAQQSGPSWYTRGRDGMYAQVYMWLQKGLEAARGLE